MATDKDYVDTQHPEYADHLEFWNRCRTVAAGSDAVKAEGTLYLPDLKGQKASEYARYKGRALFYGATGRTVQGMVGALCGKEPILVAPAGNDDFFDTIVPYTTPIKTLIKRIAEEVITVGRVGFLLDAPVGGGDPRLLIYKAEDIVNWSTRNVDGKEELSMVVLRENVARGTERFDRKTQVQYRVLFIEPDSGNYTQEVWIERDNARGNAVDKFTLAETINPVRSGQTLQFIPFYFINENGTSPNVALPPILGLVNVNISHYVSSADLEHGRHFTALPVVHMSGVDDDKDAPELVIGSENAWITAAGTTVSYLEFSGNGLAALENALKEKQEMMRALGSNLLALPRAASESAENQRMRRSGENNIIANIADSLSEGLTSAVRDLAEWRSINDFSEISIAVNKDSMGVEPNPQLLAQLITMLQNGTISEATFHFNLNNQGLLPDGVSFEDEKALIEEERAARPAPPAPAVPEVDTPPADTPPAEAS